MHTELLVAHSLLMSTFATVKQEHDGSGALRNFPVTTMHAFKGSTKRYLCAHGNLNRRARAVALEGVLVEEYTVVVLGDQVKVLRSGNDR